MATDFIIWLLAQIGNLTNTPQKTRTFTVWVSGNGQGGRSSRSFPVNPRWFPGVTICNGKLYVISGRDQPVGGVQDVQPYNAHKVDADGTTVYVAFREVWEYDLATGEWQELARPPRTFACEAFTVADR